jgi:HK97 family phage portal protein
MHPLSQLFEGRPHPHYTTFDFFQTLISNACLGNGYARIYRDNITQRPYALEIIPQDIVTVESTESGEIFYRISGHVNERPVHVVLPETEMLHIKGVTMTGIAGRPLRLVHKTAFGKAQGAQQYAKTYFEKGAAVGGLITFPNALSAEEREIIRKRIAEKHAGASNAGSVMVLDTGADFKPMQSGPKDSAVIDFSNLSTVEVSQIFKVPLHLLSQLDRSTFSNMEQQNQDFVVHCLAPWARKIEEEINSKLLTTNEVKRRKVFFEFDLSPLTMGDMQAQAAFFASAIQNGWMTPNEVRAKKNLNRIEGGDKLFIQQNMAPMDMLEEILKGKNGQEKQMAAESQDDEPQPQNANNATDGSDI